MKVKSLSHIRLFATPWTVAHQAPLSMGFSRQEYWSGLPFPSPQINIFLKMKPMKTNQRRSDVLLLCGNRRKQNEKSPMALSEMFSK